MQQQKEAESLLNSMEQTDPVSFLSNLVDVLVNGASRSEARQLSGLMVKNLLKNSKQLPYLVDLWIRTPSDLSSSIRTRVLGTLAHPDRAVRNSASQVVASITSLDLPRGEWFDVLQVLITNASNVNPEFKEASIMTLGYTLEDLPENTLSQEDVNKILTPIVGCVRAGEDINMMIVSIRALKNSLKFIKANMQANEERKYIIETAATCSQHSNEDLRFESLQMLCDAAYYYHDYIGSELNTLGTVTFNCIKSDVRRNVVMAVEFWTIIADSEKALLENGQPYKGYINIAFNSLTDFAIAKINDYEETDDDEWNSHKAFATLVGSMAATIGDAVVDKMHGFIVSEIGAPEWTRRESAILVLGMILEGPSPNKIGPLLNDCLSSILGLLGDMNNKVRKTTAWTLSKICEQHLSCIPNAVQGITPKLLESLDDKPGVATHICWGIICIIDYDPNSFTNEQLEHIFGKLLSTAYRKDAFDSEHSLQMAAFSALSSLIENAHNGYTLSLIHI